jgi:hypothetical protein
MIGIGALPTTGAPNKIGCLLHSLLKEIQEWTAAVIRARVTERWNTAIAAGHDVWWSPTRAALVAGVPYADVFCPGCRTSRSIDLRTIDRHPFASVGSLALGLRCSWCQGNAPMPKIAGLYAAPQLAQTKSTI